MLNIIKMEKNISYVEKLKELNLSMLWCYIFPLYTTPVTSSNFINA